MPARYSLSDIKDVVKKNREKQTEFLSDERLLELQDLFCPKGKTVRTGKGYTHKLFVEIGLQTLSVSVKKGKTKNGYPKITVSFHKNPVPSWWNNSDLSYDTIDCTHLIMNETTGNFSKQWFKPFSKNFTEKDFNKIPKGAKIKCIVSHVEERFIQNGQQMYYKQGRNFAKPIILTKPEITEVFHIDTPNEDIEIDYFKLHKKVKQ